MRRTDQSANEVETPDDHRLPSVEDERYGAFDAEDGSTVLFDREGEDAWVQRDCAVELRP